MQVITQEQPAIIELAANNILVLENLRTMEMHNFTAAKAKVKVKVYSNFFIILVSTNIVGLYHSSSWSFKII